MVDRRQFMVAASAAASALAAPRLAAAVEQRVLRFVPHTDPAVVDPHWSPAYVTRNHGYLCYDTLFGQDASLTPRPQMIEGVAVEDDGRRWTLTLRTGLRFHDGTPVLARDCVASLRRWGARDEFGKTLFAVTDELLAADDRRLVFRLSRPYPMLPMALSKTGLMMAAIMPERLASADAMRPLTEVIGSGPYRYRADERVPGDRVVYERFSDYVPRSDGVTEGTAGPKIAYFDRIEWCILPDASTAAAALQTGEVHWWELPSADMLPLLRRSRGVQVETLDPLGYMASLRVNHAQGPTSLAAVRRAITRAICQRDIVMAMAGTDPDLWRDRVGYFTPDTPLANEAGMEAIAGQVDTAAVRQALAAAGYDGQPFLLMVPQDIQINAAACAVVADQLKQVGVTVQYLATDWSTLLQRRNRKEPPAQGGWSGYVVLNSGVDLLDPFVHAALRGNASAVNGWCDSPAIETLREAWLSTPTADGRKALARRLQRQAFHDVPYIPLGQIAQLTALRSDLAGMVRGFPVFWNIRRV
jgi:peptide/nickel transport system substrate-binding protein